MNTHPREDVVDFDAVAPPALKALFGWQEETDTRTNNTFNSPVMDWLLEAASLPGKSPVAVAALLAYLALRHQRTQNLWLNAAMLGKLDLSRQSSYNGLAMLEDAGLITTRRRRGRAPLASLVIEQES